MTWIETIVASGPVFLSVSLICLTVSWLRDMPRPGSHTEECPKGCHPPMLIPQYRNSTGWRCGYCGTRWRIDVDLTKSRREYRQWVPK